MKRLTDSQIEKALKNRGISGKVIKLMPELIRLQRAVIKNKARKKEGLKPVKFPLLVLLELARQTARNAHDYKITIYQSKVIVDLANKLFRKPDGYNK